MDVINGIYTNYAYGIYTHDEKFFSFIKNGCEGIVKNTEDELYFYTHEEGKEVETILLNNIKLLFTMNESCTGFIYYYFI